MAATAKTVLNLCSIVRCIMGAMKIMQSGNLVLKWFQLIGPIRSV
jgi:hypothetical protein